MYSEDLSGEPGGLIEQIEQDISLVTCPGGSRVFTFWPPTLTWVGARTSDADTFW